MNLASKEEEIIESYNDIEEEYEEVTEFGVLEENRRKQLQMNILFGIIIIIILAIIIDIIAVAGFDKGPYFAIKGSSYDDGGTTEYYGIGYKVIKYHQIQGRRDKELGFWNLQYNTTAITVKDSELALELANSKAKTYSKYYKKFVRITSTLQEINTEKHQITMTYLDRNEDYSLDIICQIVKDQPELAFTLDKKITVIGTIKDWKTKTKTKNNRLYVSNCFAEQ